MTPIITRGIIRRKLFATTLRTTWSHIYGNQIVVLFYEMFDCQRHAGSSISNYCHAALWNSVADYLTTTKRGTGLGLRTTLQ